MIVRDGVIGDYSRDGVKTWREFRQSRNDRRRPLVIAHRGAPREMPENTLASFALALEQGADVLETDLRFSQDGTIVLVHDEMLDRTTDGSGMVAAHTLSEIKSLRTRAPSRKYVQEPTTTLIELLRMTQASVPLLLELKDPLFVEESYAQQLIHTLDEYGMLDKCAVVSFEMERVRVVEHVCSELPSGVITLTEPWPVKGAQLLGPAWPLLFLNPLYVAWARRNDSLVAPLDTSPEKRMWYYLWLGVDAVLADRPDEAIRAIKARVSEQAADAVQEQEQQELCEP